eukprot:COSAG05_NODE_1507_length_4689_cov_90.821569_6_plen_74_part_00
MVINGASHAHIDIVGISQSCMVIIGVAFTINAGTSRRSRLVAISWLVRREAVTDTQRTATMKLIFFFFFFFFG